MAAPATKQLADLDDRERGMLAAAAVKFLAVYLAVPETGLNKLTWYSRLVGRPRGVPIGVPAARELFREALAAARETVRVGAVVSRN